MDSVDLNPYASPLATGTTSPKTATTWPKTADARIRVTRTTNYADRLRAYRINIDGVEAARIRAAENVEIPVSGGHHRISARIDWCGSPAIEFDISPGETLEFECGSNLRGIRILLAIIYTSLLRDEYLTLRLVS